MPQHSHAQSDTLQVGALEEGSKAVSLRSLLRVAMCSSKTLEEKQKSSLSSSFTKLKCFKDLLHGRN